MYRTPSVLGPLQSGFVPFASGAPMDDIAEAETKAVVARVAAAPVAAPTSEALPGVWTPASSARIRAVEVLVVAAICGYFGFGLLGTLAGF